MLTFKNILFFTALTCQALAGPGLLSGADSITQLAQAGEEAGNVPERSPRRRRPRLTEQEQEFLQGRQSGIVKAESEKQRSQPPVVQGPLAGELVKSAVTEKMRVEVVDRPILDLFRMISKAYKINIVPEADLQNVNINIHLENISVIEGLQVICRSKGLELIELNGVYYVREADEKAITEISRYSKRMDIKVENESVKDFIKEFAITTGLSIAPGQNLEGKVTGYFKDVLPINGFKAIMSANSFRVRLKSGIYIVEKEGAGESIPTRRGRTTSSGDMDIDVLDGKVTASLSSAVLGDAIRDIAQQADMNMVIYGSILGNVDAEIKDVDIDKTLSVLLQGTNYTFIIKEGMMLIGERNPNSPSGQVLSAVEVHNLKYIRADEALKLFPKSLSSGVSVLKEQNAILITGTAETINQVKEFLEKVDLPVPQVLIEVIIVEYDRTNSSEFGIGTQPPPTGGPALQGQFGLSGVKALFTKGSFTGSIGILPQDFSIHLRSILERNKGKVLSMPKITTLNGNKAHLQVRKTSHWPVTSFNKDGVPGTDYRSLDDGITIELTPWVTQHGDVNLEIKPSIKTTQPGNESGRPGDITDRSITTNVRLLDGETLVLGGLIENKEKIEQKFIPILGQIPFLGNLFSSRHKSLSTMELVLYVTPHILQRINTDVNLGEELERLDERSGFIEKEDFLGKRPAPDTEKIDIHPDTVDAAPVSPETLKTPDILPEQTLDSSSVPAKENVP